MLLKMFGPLETKDLAQIAITVVGLAVIFLYFNRRLTSMTSLIHQHESMITSNSTEEQNGKFEAFGEILHALNDRISNLENANHALAQQLEAIKHQRNTISVVPEQLQQQQRAKVHQSAPTIHKQEPVIRKKEPVVEKQNVVVEEPTPEKDVNDLDGETMDQILSEELNDLVEDEDVDLKKEQ